MSAAAIAKALDGYASSSGWHRAPCPVHGSAGLTLALKDTPRRLAVKCHAGCSRVDVLAQLAGRELLVEPGAERVIPEPSADKRQREADAADRRRRISSALDIWNEEAVPADNTVVGVYLWSRLLVVKPVPDRIRLHRLLRHWESADRRPAMLALVEHIEHGPVAVHATYLATDGSRKATLDPVRKTFGPIGGAAVRLAPIRGDGTPLIVGEGIETTLSVMVSTGFAGWAALSANGISALMLPPNVRNVLIAADHDDNGVGERAAYNAAWRWLQEGRRVRVMVSPSSGTDWNDVLRGKAPGHTGVRHAG